MPRMGGGDDKPRYYLYCGELPFKTEEESKKGRLRSSWEPETWARYKVNGPVWSKADPWIEPHLGHTF